MATENITFEKKEIVYALDEEEARKKVQDMYSSSSNVIVNNVSFINLNGGAYIVSFSYEK